MKHLRKKNYLNTMISKIMSKDQVLILMESKNSSKDNILTNSKEINWWVKVQILIKLTQIMSTLEIVK